MDFLAHKIFQFPKTISVRRISKKLGITHPTMLALIDNPKKELARKTMIRIVQRGTKKQPKKEIPIKCPWCKRIIEKRR